jgi:hypothetical protein
MSTGFIWLGWGLVAGCYELDKETSGFIKGVEYPDQLR